MPYTARVIPLITRALLAFMACHILGLACPHSRLYILYPVHLVMCGESILNLSFYMVSEPLILSLLFRKP